MDHIKQIIAIAEYCGWKEIGKSGVYQNTIKGINGCVPGGAVHSKRIQMKLPGANSFLVPNYLNDLNAMHEAEKTLSDVSPGKDKNGDNIPSDIARYRLNLCIVCMSNGGPITATAAQRAEAFLKTIGKWE